jgi:predicted RNA-binding protein with RPS1 domain
MYYGIVNILLLAVSSILELKVLVHISQLKAGFVSDVNEVVKLHHVEVKVTEVDEDRKKYN